MISVPIGVSANSNNKLRVSDFESGGEVSTTFSLVAGGKPRGTLQCLDPVEQRDDFSSPDDWKPNTMPSNPRAVQQLKPQLLTSAPSTSSILVSPRQKGNPILTHIRTIPWEYSASIPCDFLLSPSTCCLFLQLKYHKLHPEYIYTRIRGLEGKYALRLVLVLVDIDAHEESLKELTKTSVVNNVTVLLSWSAHEAGRYIELFKSYEHSGATAIKGIQSDSYVDRLIGFVTTPRGINRADAVSLVSNFGTIRTAMNAASEEVGMVGGWGERKVARWHAAVREPFRSKFATRKVLTLEKKSLEGQAEQSLGGTRTEELEALIRDIDGAEGRNTEKNMATPAATSSAAIEVQNKTRKRPASPEVTDGVLAALSKLRNQ